MYAGGRFSFDTKETDRIGETDEKIVEEFLGFGDVVLE